MNSTATRIPTIIRKHLVCHTGIVVQDNCTGLHEALGLRNGEMMKEWLFISAERRHGTYLKPYALRFREISRQEAKTLINTFELLPVFSNPHGTIYDVQGEPFRHKFAGCIYTYGV